MTTSRHPADDRETLSALFDNELRADAGRFALKRLGHDAQWRESCGRWQLYGDVMRGQAGAIAAGGFADRVALAIAQEPQVQAVAAPARPAAQRRGWIGGALAASVAVAALFVTRPFSDEPATSADSPARVASAPAAAAPVRSVAATAAPQLPATPRTPDPALSLGAAAVAAVEVPRRVADRRTSRGQSQRAAARARQAPVQVAAAGAAVVATALAPAVSTATSPRPFQPQHVETASRPWPRAVLPQYSGGNAMTASFGGELQPSPSFYPFEPPASDTDATVPGAESPRR